MLLHRERNVTLFYSKCHYKCNFLFPLLTNKHKYLSKWIEVLENDKCLYLNNSIGKQHSTYDAMHVCDIGFLTTKLTEDIADYLQDKSNCQTLYLSIKCATIAFSKRKYISIVNTLYILHYISGNPQMKALSKCQIM